MDGVNLDDLASAFGFNIKSEADWSTLGKVTAVNADGTISALLGGSATPTTCAAYCAADVGDIVYCIISHGKARAIARQGGDGGGETYTLSKSGDTITLTGSGGSTSSVTDSDTTDLTQMTGVLPIANGGTGQSTAQAAFDALATPLIYVNQVTSASGSRGAHATGSVSVTLTAPAGFKIAHVLSVASNGGIVPAYVEQSISALTGKTSQTVTVWWHNGMNNAQTCTFSVRYMCVRDGFLTTNGTSAL